MAPSIGLGQIGTSRHSEPTRSSPAVMCILDTGRKRFTITSGSGPSLECFLARNGSPRNRWMLLTDTFVFELDPRRVRSQS